MINNKLLKKMLNIKESKKVLEKTLNLQFQVIDELLDEKKELKNRLEQREKFIDTLFEILNATQAETLSDISSKVFSNAKTMVKTYQNLDSETKKIMIKTLEEFLKIGKSNISIPKLKRNN